MPTPTTTQAQVLAEFAAQRRLQGRTGRLIGLDLAGRDALWAEEHAAFQAAAEAAQAQGGGEVDGAGLSLVDGGDTWVLDGQGQWSRHLSESQGLAPFLAQVAQAPAPQGPAPLAPQLAALDEASWAPSATNGQPMRAWLLNPADAPHWRALLGDAAWPEGATGWLLVRKRKYDSLMGDVFEPFGLEVTAREESIDAGIFAASLAWGLAARGLGQVESVLAPAQRAQARDLALKSLEALGPDAGPVAEEILQGLRSGARLVDALVAVGQGPASAPLWPEWPALVGARSTQRVASPSRPLGAEVEAQLWAEALASLPPGSQPEAFRLVGFDRAQASPAAIGRAMFDRLYGEGADPESRQGGEGGILSGATLRNLLLEAERRQPGAVAAQLGPDWEGLEDKALAVAAKAFALGPQMLGPHLLARLGAEGRYVIEGDRLMDARGQCLSAPTAVRLMKSLAATFGRHFLAFQTTHPRNAVILANDTVGESHLQWRLAGRLAAALSYLARARGLSAIVKTGPVDLAPMGVAEALATNLDALPDLDGLAQGLRSGQWRPSFTFQVGWPLAGSERIGGPEGHDGFEERRRDKRPPRLGPEAFLLVP